MAGAPASKMNNVSCESSPDIFSQCNSHPEELLTCRGQCLILRRNSSKIHHVEGEGLKQTLRGLHLDVTEATPDEQTEPLMIIKETRRRVTNEDVCLVVYLEQTNPKLKISDVIDLFSPSSCPELCSKPKILIIESSTNAQYQREESSTPSPIVAEDFFIFEWAQVPCDEAEFRKEFSAQIDRCTARLRNNLDVNAIIEMMKSDNLLDSKAGIQLAQQLSVNVPKTLLSILIDASTDTQRQFLTLLSTTQPEMYEEVFGQNEMFKGTRQAFEHTLTRIMMEHAYNKDILEMATMITKEVSGSGGIFGGYHCIVKDNLSSKFYFVPGIPNLLPVHEEAAEQEENIRLIMVNISYHARTLVGLVQATPDLLQELASKNFLSDSNFSRLSAITTVNPRSHHLLGVFSRMSNRLLDLLDYFNHHETIAYREAACLMAPWKHGNLRVKFDVQVSDHEQPIIMKEFYSQTTDKHSRFRQTLKDQYGITEATQIQRWTELHCTELDKTVKFLEDLKHGQLYQHLVDSLDIMPSPAAVVVSYCEEEPLAALMKHLKHSSQPLLPGGLVLNQQPIEASNSVSTTNHRQQSHEFLNAIRGTLFMMIASKNHSEHDFAKLLKTKLRGSEILITDLKNERGMTVLHSICEHERVTFLSTLVRMAYWAPLRQLRVPINQVERCSGMDGRQIAENVARVRQLTVEYDEMERWELSLNQMHQAAREGNQREVEKLLRRQSRLKDEKDYFGCSVLYWACVSGDIDLVQKLCRSGGVNPRGSNKKKETLLHIACMMGHSHLIKPLIDLGIEKEAVDISGKTALDYTAENGDIICFKTLQDLGVQLTRNLSLHAAYYGRELYYKMLVEHAYLGDTGIKGEHGKSAIMRASEASRLPVVKYILSAGHVNWPDIDDRMRTVLHWAAHGGSGLLMEHLIKAAQQDGKLNKIINSGDCYVGSELCFLIRGKDKGQRGWHYVEIKRSLFSRFEKELQSGTIDVTNLGQVVKSGWGTDSEGSAKHEFEQRFRSRVQERRRAGESVPGDSTPLHIACFRENIDAARVLLEAGADPNIQDSFHLTALHISAMRGNVALVELLEKYNADTNLRSLDNKTPVQIAEDNGHQSIVNFIRGNDFIATSTGFVKILETTKKEFATEKLEDLRNRGLDEKRHLIDTLRNISIKVNKFSMGPGPVMEESVTHHISAIRRYFEKDLMKFSQKMLSYLEEKINDFAKERLEKVRSSGRDLKQYLIDILRQIQCEVNGALLQIGSSPIMQPEDD